MSRMTRWSLILLALSALAPTGCDDGSGTGDERVEGTEPGDCSDGADNDADGLFDCDDSSCTNAPICTGGLDATDATDLAGDTSEPDTSAPDTSEPDTAEPDATDTDAVDTADMTPMCPGPTGLRPPLLSEHAGVYDPVNNRVVVYGGSTMVSMGCNIPFISGADIESATWFYDVDCDVWTRIEDSAPGQRVRHMMVYDSTEHRAILFGGRFRQTTSGAYTLFDDVWQLDLATDTWTELTVTGDTPSARVNASMVYDPGAHRVLMFGGNESTSGASYVALNDTWTLDLDTMTWSELQVGGAALPAARLFATAIWDPALEQMVIHGGADSAVFTTGSYYGDLWALSEDAEGNASWRELTAVGDVPDDRFWAGMVYDAVNEKYVLFGGHDEANTSEQIGLRNDIDVYSPRTARWTQEVPGDTFNQPIVDACMPPADFVTNAPDTPERRQAHLFVAGPDAAFAMGGKTDCGAVDDLARFDFATQTWTELTPATQGESCRRRGGTNCNALCL